MDYITRCYASSMRLFPDRLDVLVPGRWYFCEPGAQHIPYLHPFTSLGLADRDEIACETQPVLGEVYGSNSVLGNGIAPLGLTGNHWCGGEDAWENGVPYAERGLLTDADGRPVCCNAAELGKGGIAIGGFGTEAAVAKDAAGQGGVGLGGFGQEAALAPLAVAPWVQLVGSYPAGWLSSEAGGGGMAVGGAGLEAAVAGEVGQGGVKVGGAGLEAWLAGGVG